jgi:hypothetical protein
LTVRTAQTQDPAGQFQQINTISTRLTYNAGSPRLTVTYSVSNAFCGVRSVKLPQHISKMSPFADTGR